MSLFEAGALSSNMMAPKDFGRYQAIELWLSSRFRPLTFTTIYEMPLILHEPEVSVLQPSRPPASVSLVSSSPTSRSTVKCNHPIPGSLRGLGNPKVPTYMDRAYRLPSPYHEHIMVSCGAVPSISRRGFGPFRPYAALLAHHPSQTALSLPKHDLLPEYCSRSLARFHQSDTKVQGIAGEL